MASSCTNDRPALRKNDLKALSRIQQAFGIVPADKASDNFIIVCREHYNHILWNELHNSQSYTLTAEPLANIECNLRNSGGK